MSDLVVSPTVIANYVGLECCERYLWLKAVSGNQQAGDLKKTPLDPWLQKKGEAHEGAFEEHLKSLGVENIQEVETFLGDLGLPLFQAEVPIKGKIEGLTISGRIDFLIRIDKDHLIIAECKASAQDKTYQRIQAAVYALLLEEKGVKDSQAPRKAPQVMVVRQSKKTGKLHTYKLDGSKLVLDSDTQKEEPDDDEDNLPRPHIDDVELIALKEDIRTICKKIKKYKDKKDGPNFQLLPRCANCDFNEDCLGEAKGRAKKSNGDFGFEILTYGPKAKAAIGSPKKWGELKNPENVALHPPPEKLKEVRDAYYQLGLNNSQDDADKAEVLRIESRVPELPKPDYNDNTFFQFFLCVEADPTKNNQIGAISLKQIKYPPEEDSETMQTECWTKWPAGQGNGENTEAQILSALIGSVKTFIYDNNSFYAHFYFWSLSEKKLLAQACQRVIGEKKKINEEASDIKIFLHWISRHPYLREPNQFSENGNYIAANQKKGDNGLEVWDDVSSQEEHVCTQLQEEVRKCFALGSIGSTLLEVSCLNWAKNTGWEEKWCAPAVNWILDRYPWKSEQTDSCALASKDSIREKLKARQFYNDSLPPSVWDDAKAKDNTIKCYFKKRVEILQEMEAHVRDIEFKAIDQDGNELKKQCPQTFFAQVTDKKVVNQAFPSVVTDIDLVTAAREMLLIETMHQKDRWVKEATEGFYQMEGDQRAVKLVNENNEKPKWNVWGSTKEND